MRSLFFVCLILAIASAGVAQGGVLVSQPNDLLFFGDQTFLKLTNYEREVDMTGTPNILVPGDRLRGIFKVISSDDTKPILTPDRSPDTSFELTGIFDVMVRPIAMGPNGVQPFGATNALFEFVPYAPFETTYGAGAMLALFHDTTPDFNQNLAFAAGEATATDSDTGLPYLTMGAAPGADWGDANGDGNGYYWASSGSVLPSVSTFTASLALLVNNTGIPTINFLPISVQPPTQSPNPPTFTNEPALQFIQNVFALQGNTVVNPELASPWPIRSQDPILLQVVPEPGAMLIWTLLGLSVSAMAWIRRRRA